MLPGQQERRITLRGTPAQIEEAKRLIAEKVSRDARMGGDNCITAKEEWPEIWRHGADRVIPEP